MSAIEGRHWWFVARRRIIAHLIERFIRPRAGAAVLEAGCGTGGNLALLAGYGALSAFEFDEEARALANARGVCVAVPGALPDGVIDVVPPFDLIAMLDVLEHIDDDRASLARLGGMLADDGQLLLTVPALPALWSNHDVLHHHKRRYTRASLSAVIEAAGLKVERIGYFNGLLLPLAAAQRWASRLTKHEEPLDAVPAPWLNGALQAVFASERHLLGRVSLPLGLSLYAIARKP
jgi:SAM-dependent methyltransferase